MFFPCDPEATVTEKSSTYGTMSPLGPSEACGDSRARGGEAGLGEKKWLRSA